MNKDYINLKKDLINIDITINSLEKQLQDYKNERFVNYFVAHCSLSPFEDL